MTRDQIADMLINLPKGRTKAPDIYNYEAFKNNSDAKFLQKMLSKLTGYTPYFDKEQADNMSALLWEGDSLCNEALISMQKNGFNPHEVMGKFLKKGISGVDNPTIEMQKLWESISETPSWLDWDKLERGAKVFRIMGSEGFQLQGVLTIQSYRNDFISKTLMHTGKYSDATAFNRYLLTCNFWMEISEKEGMKAFNKGWKVALRVRLLHTLIRQSILSSGKWETERLGMPINYVGMLGAPLISSLLMPYFTKILGFKVTDEEIDDSMHLWRYIHWLMGGNDTAFPKSIEEGLQAVFISYGMAPVSDHEDGIRLGKSFIQSFKPSNSLTSTEKKKRKKEYETNLAHSFFFVPKSTRKIINMPNTFFPMLKYMSSNYLKNRKMSTKRLASKEFADNWDEKITKERRAWVERNLKEHKLDYRP